jgi:DNA-binding NtrC family response regulator
VRQALEATRGHKTKAAKMLGVHPNTMTRMMQELSDEDARQAN